MDSWKRLNKLGLSRRFLPFFCLFFPTFWMLLLLNSNLPELPYWPSTKETKRMLNHDEMPEKTHLGEFGELMVSMLPDDLAFTTFIPSEESFRSVLRLQPNDSVSEQKVNDTFAVLSRVMGFSTVPQHLPSSVVTMHKEITLDSVSGYRLNVWKVSNGLLMVNNILSKRVDIKRGQIIIHVIHGVVMDIELEQSLGNDYEDQ